MDNYHTLQDFFKEIASVGNQTDEEFLDYIKPKNNDLPIGNIDDNSIQMAANDIIKSIQGI